MECESLSGKCVTELVGFSKDTCHRTQMKSDTELCDGCMRYCILRWTDGLKITMDMFGSFRNRQFAKSSLGENLFCE